MRRVLGFIALMVSTSAAQTTAQYADCAKETVVVAVTDERGAPVLDLGNLTFTPSSGSGSPKIMSVTPLKTPPRVLLLVDSTDNMKAFSNDLIAAFNHVVLSLPQDTKLAIASFGKELQIRTVFGATASQNNESANDIFRNPKSWRGHMPLLEAIAESTRIFGAPEPGDSIIVFSSGGNSSEKLDAKQLESILVKSGIALHFRWIVSEPVHGGVLIIPPTAVGPLQAITQVSGESGGTVTMTKLASSSLANLRAYMAARYLIELELPQAETKAKKWKLTAQSKIDQKQRIYLYYPHKLPPCQIAQTHGSVP